MFVASHMTVDYPYVAMSTISFGAFMDCLGREVVDSRPAMRFSEIPHWRGMVPTAPTTSFPSHHLPFVLG